MYRKRTREHKAPSLPAFSPLFHCFYIYFVIYFLVVGIAYEILRICADESFIFAVLRCILRRACRIIAEDGIAYGRVAVDKAFIKAETLDYAEISEFLIIVAR